MITGHHIDETVDQIRVMLLDPSPTREVVTILDSAAALACGVRCQHLLPVDVAGRALCAAGLHLARNLAQVTGATVDPAGNVRAVITPNASTALRVTNAVTAAGALLLLGEYRGHEGHEHRAATGGSADG